MDKLKIAPDEASYSFVFAPTAKASDIGTNTIFAENIKNKWIAVLVQWTLDPHECDYLFAVNRFSESNGHPPFLIDLITKSGTPEEHIACILPGSFSLKSVSGKTFVVSCTLEVKPSK